MSLSNSVHSFLLVRYPKVLDKLRGEIDLILKGKEDFNRDDLKRLLFLSNVLTESIGPPFLL
jgi:hypothetical protein